MSVQARIDTGSAQGLPFAGLQAGKTVAHE
jgi:hypothetical protein